MYDSITRKATLKCLTRVREEDYKLKEKLKLKEIKAYKEAKLKVLEEKLLN